MAKFSVKFFIALHCLTLIKVMQCISVEEDLTLTRSEKKALDEVMVTIAKINKKSVNLRTIFNCILSVKIASREKPTQ